MVVAVRAGVPAALFPKNSATVLTSLAPPIFEVAAGVGGILVSLA